MTFPSETSIRRLSIRFGWVVPVLFYVATMARSVGYVDAALVLNNAFFPRLSAWVNNHNLFSIMGWLWMKIVPVGDEFFRLNLLSSLCGAFTVYFAFRACLEYTESLGASVIAAIGLMVSHSLWWHSTMLEVYTLNTLLLALIMFSFARYYSGGRKVWLYAALLFWGLGISNHILMGLLAVAFLAVVIAERKRLRVADVAIGIACLVAGLAVFLIACARTGQQYGSLARVLHMATGGDFKALMFPGESGLFWRLNYIGLVIYQYPSLVLVYIAVGLYRLVADHRKMDLVVLAAIVPLAVWSASYFVWDMFAFALPVYVLLALPLARGLAALSHRRILRTTALLTLATPILLYSTLPRTSPVQRYVAQYEMSAMVEDAFDPAVYFLNPIKTGFNDVDRHVRSIAEALPPGAWYFDNAYDFPIRLYYQQVLEEHRDLNCPEVFVFWVTESEIQSVSRRINALVGGGTPVFINRYVFATTRAHLLFTNLEPVRINDREIYRLS